MNTLVDMSSKAVRIGTNVPSKIKVRRLPREQTLSLILFVAILVIWQASITYFSVPEFVFPSPVAVMRWVVQGLTVPISSPASLVYHLGVTLIEAFLGFLIGGVFGTVTGMALAHWSAAERILYPYIQAFNALPKIAIAPLMVIWLGFGMEPKVVMAAILVFFPMLVNSMAGYHSVEPDRIDLARTCNANGVQIFWKIIIPSALPFIFAGLHMATILAILGAIVGEFVGATSGLGMLLMQYNNNMQVSGVFAVLFVLGLIGYILNIIVTKLENKFCFWAKRQKNFG